MKSFLNTTLRNVLWFKSAHDKGELDVKPPFQRNPVWVERQKSFLIDSILSGFPIPEIYMQEVISAQGKAKHIIVDGQQRIRAVLEFLEERYEINGKDSPTWADMSFEDLNDDEKKTIFEYNFIVRILPEMDDIQIRAIFQRLNINVLPLNKQELRHATYWGPFIELMNAISNKEVWQKIDIFASNDIRRMLDVEYISELTIAYLNGPQNKKKNVEKYYQIYEQEFEFEELVDETFNSVLSEIVKILPDINKTRWSKKTDFYTVFLIFAKHLDSLPLAKDQRQNASEILLEFGEQLNEYVRATPDKESTFSDDVKTYGAGIRASTDLGSRQRREEGLENILSELWN